MPDGIMLSKGLLSLFFFPYKNIIMLISLGLRERLQKISVVYGTGQISVFTKA
jgi:hypothetical protein